MKRILYILAAVVTVAACGTKSPMPAGNGRLSVTAVQEGSFSTKANDVLADFVVDAILLIGQASRRSAITPERVAINVMDARIPDNAGQQPQNAPIRPSGPAAYFSTLPLRAMVQAIEAAGLPAVVSNTAGTFVCNDLFYGVMDYLAARSPAVPAGFIHVPCTPEQAAAFDPPLRSMALPDIVKGLEAAIGALL